MEGPASEASAESSSSQSREEIVRRREAMGEQIHAAGVVCSSSSGAARAVGVEEERRRKKAERGLLAVTRLSFSTSTRPIIPLLCLVLHRCTSSSPYDDLLTSSRRSNRFPHPTGTQRASRKQRHDNKHHSHHIHAVNTTTLIERRSSNMRTCETFSRKIGNRINSDETFNQRSRVESK